ncbi:unnamed protein product [Durusdinium trenchii]|uniref:t-SNARE coiled-coil homology domain-containing protein n=1 Tax=Durusdinium trenchii TaxID=1381693 RepID=A0ABP0IIA0_9DINO
MTPAQFDILLKRLIEMGTPKVVVFLIILVWFLDIPKPQNEYQLLEFYAGVGRIASLAKWCGFSTVAVDIQYGAHRQREGKRRPMDINGNAGLVLCIHLLLTSEWEQVVAFFAIVCSSYVPVNRHSTGRTLLTPLGNENYIGVRRSNKMTSRTVILIWITILSGGTYLMENPSGSFLAFHPRYVWMLQKLKAIGILTYKTAFWMRKYGSISWKRTWVWANSRRIGSLDLGPLTEEEKEGCEETTIRYKDAQGNTRWKGNANLKLTQHYTFKFAGTVTRLLPKLREDSGSHKFPVPLESTISLFARMPWDHESVSWEEEGDLRDVIEYELKAAMMDSDAKAPEVSPGGVLSELARPGTLTDPLDDCPVEGMDDPYLTMEGVDDPYLELANVDDPYLVMEGVDESVQEGGPTSPKTDPLLAHIDTLFPVRFRKSWFLKEALLLVLNQWGLLKGPRVSVDKNEVKKIRRLMTPRADGSLLVPPEFLEKWKDLQNGGRDADIFLKKMHRRVESINQQDLWVDGEFMSEQDMIDANIPPRDKYEKHVELFWVEKKMAGRRLTKRKREILQEEEDLSETEYDKLKQEECNMPAIMAMDKDDTGLHETITSFDDAPDHISQLSERADTIYTSVSNLTDKLTAINTTGIVDGFHREQLE